MKSNDSDKPEIKGIEYELNEEVCVAFTDYATNLRAEMLP
jgi:hypothetical protein